MEEEGEEEEGREGEEGELFVGGGFAFSEVSLRSRGCWVGEDGGWRGGRLPGVGDSFQFSATLLDNTELIN